MLDAHKQLLATIQDAQKQATVLAARGASIMKIQRDLAQAADKVQQRIREYAAAAPPPNGAVGTPRPTSPKPKRA